MAYYLFNVSLEISLQQSICLIQNKELALAEKSVISFDKIFESTGCTDYQLCYFIINFSIIFFDHSTSDEVFDIDFFEFTNFLS